MGQSDRHIFALLNWILVITAQSDKAFSDLSRTTVVFRCQLSQFIQWKRSVIWCADTCTIAVVSLLVRSYRSDRPGESNLAYTPISLRTSSTNRVSAHSPTSILGAFSKVPAW